MDTNTDTIVLRHDDFRFMLAPSGEWNWKETVKF